MLDEPSNGWANYDRAQEMLPRVVGRSWRELDTQFVDAFHEAPIFAGGRTFGLMLPAYLAFLLELDGFSHALYVVAGQLTRKDDPVDQRIFDARVEVMTAEQRTVVRRIVEHLAGRPAMERAMRPAVATWNQN